MAKKQIITLIDDLSGEEADVSIAFSVDGTSYEIDLTDKHAKEFEDALKPYTSVAAITNKKRKPSTGTRPSTGNRPAPYGDGLSKQERADVRAWAQRSGRTVNDRGQIPMHLLRDYRARR